jgi:hypothetical protein
MARIQFRSAPAQKALPWPASTTARSVSSCDSARKVAVSSAMTWSLKALRTSGRLSQTSATKGEGRLSSSVVVITGLTSGTRRTWRPGSAR